MLQEVLVWHIILLINIGLVMLAIYLIFILKQLTS